MDQITKTHLKSKLNVTNGMIAQAKGLAGLPATPHVPIQALNPLVIALQELSKTIEMLIDKS